jgi:capsular exopolysaccharide synthesis family protein
VSRIQDILNKAERDGAVRRTRTVTEGPTPPAAVAEPAPPIERPRPAPPPWTDRPDRHHGPDVAASARATAPREVQAGTISPMLVAALAPHGVPAEQYRSLRTRIALSENGRTRRVLAITSPGLGDGKSVTAANLALTMAQEVNSRVVLVDADLRRPSVHALFGLPQGPGLSAVLAGDATLEDAVVELPDYRLAVVTAGIPPERPAELLGSAAMRRVLDALRSRFDRVLLDTPPALPLADVGVLAPLTDGLVLIVRAAATSKPMIERALAAFDQDRLVGLVLNATGTDERQYTDYRAYTQG